MHRVLRIPEVLLNIFGNLVSSGLSTEDCRIIGRDLATLARTCRTFKEPALDILWSELDDPSPLSWCLPEISHRAVSKNQFYGSRKLLFTRPLEQAEWDILRRYTRRVWCIHNFHFTQRFDWSFLSAPAGESLFPNLRSLRCTFTEEIIPFLHLPFPSLIQLDIHFDDEPDVDPSTILEDPLKSLVRQSPKLKRLNVEHFINTLELSKIVSDSICGWSNLQAITCPDVPLSTDVFVHLSHIPTLAWLTFTLNDMFLDSPAPSDPLSFPALRYMRLDAESLSPVSRLLFWIRLPAITDFIVAIDICPPKQDLALFMAGAQISGMSRTVREFDLKQLYDDPGDVEHRPLDAPSLDLNDLRPCMAFGNLCRMNIDLDWNVRLSNDELLTLGSEWPQLQEFSINSNWGWNSRGGITPAGLAQLLETCPLLMSIALVIDTRGFTRPSAGWLRRNVHLSSFNGPFRLNVIDSAIKAKSKDAMVAFLLDIVPHFHFTLTSWVGWDVTGDPDLEYHPYRNCWEDVYTRASEIIKMRTLDILRQLHVRS